VSNKLYTFATWIRKQIIDRSLKAIKSLYAERITVLLVIIIVVLTNQPPRVELHGCQRMESKSYLIYFVYSVFPDLDCIEKEGVQFRYKLDNELKRAQTESNQKIEDAIANANASVERARVEAAREILKTIAPAMSEQRSEEIVEALLENLDNKPPLENQP
jgi:hypothetical protein